MRGLVCTVLQAPRVAPAGSTSGALDGHRLRHRPALPRQCMAQLRALSAKFEGRGPAAAAAAAAGNLFSGRSWGWVGGRRGKVGNGGTVVCRDRSGDVGPSSPLQLESGEPDALRDWPKVALSLFVIGFLLGPLLDGIHSRVGLQEYDNGAINILGLKTNVWVPPLLGVYYSVVGLLQLLLDRQFARKGQAPRTDFKRVAGSFVTLAALLELSAELYKAGVPYNIEAYILFIAAEANWVLFEGTWWGFALACLVGIGAPLAEVPVEKYFGLWHYPKPNYEIFGVGAVTWVLSCYFFYTPFVSNLSRWLSAYFRQKAPKSS